jgi:anti-sigma factor RsiW
MCDVQAKLIAWLDRELSSDEAAGVERHIEGCKECRSRLAAYELVSETFDVYCDAVLAAKRRRRVPRWVPLFASGVVATVVVYFAISRTRIDLRPALIPATTAASVALPAPPEVEAVPRKTIHRRQAHAPVPVRTAKWQPIETAVQIAIPADAMFPPGAVPKGLNFIAELSIAPDGSVKQIRLRQ